VADDRLLLSTSIALPSKTTEQVLGIARGSDYNEQVVKLVGGGKHSFNDEGTFFTAGNAAPLTGLAGHAAPTAVPTPGTTDTKPYIVIRNGNSVASRIRMHIEYIRLTMTAIGTAGTSINYVSHVDTNTTSRYSSGTVNRLVAVSPNGDLTTTSNAQIDVGPYVATAGSTTTGRLVDHGVVRPVIGVVADVYEFEFNPAGPVPNSIITTGTTQVSLKIRHNPVALGPLQSLLFYLHSPSQSAASSYEVRIGWVER
jgi:hypothetical protein